MDCVSLSCSKIPKQSMYIRSLNNNVDIIMVKCRQYNQWDEYWYPSQRGNYLLQKQLSNNVPP